jgi:transcriptional regulator with XRE-family HTH domain
MDIEDASVFWERIKRLIKKKNLSQPELAKICGISVRTLQGWIFRNVFPTVVDSYYIARALDVTVEYLVTGKTRQEQQLEHRLKSIQSLLDQAREKLDKVVEG